MPRITSARVIVTCPGRNFVTLKIETDEGVYGIGDATLNGRELAVASYLEDHVVPCLIGRDAHRIEDIWQYLYKGAYWRRGPVTMAAIASSLTPRARSAGRYWLTLITGGILLFLPVPWLAPFLIQPTWSPLSSTFQQVLGVPS